MSQYAIPIELMMNFLDLTGSGEFLEEFIDYALSKVSASVKAYSTTTEEVTYDLQTYNIKKDFIIEMYDMRDVGNIDPEKDNFKAYKEIIFDRIYNGNSIKKVTDIPNFEDDIDYSDEEHGNYKVSKLSSYLKNAYNPGFGFNLGTMEVTEHISTIKKENSWRLVPSEITTWYGDMEYTEPTIEAIYSIPDSTQEDTEEEYNNFTYKSLTEYNLVEDETKEIRYISSKLVSDIGGESNLGTTDHKTIDSQDIYNDAMQTKPGVDDTSHYWNWTMNGLAEIAEKDGGDGHNNHIGAGSGVDYIYSKYTRTNTKKYVEKTKSKMEILNTSNITQGSNTIEAELLRFLGTLLKNETGEINGGIFKKDGIAVRYDDIYYGKTPAGDLLLDNGAEMLFELLEASPNTQSIVNVFKYLAYLYTGHDYGVTSADDITYIFNLRNRTGLYGGTIEEKVWFALKNEGFSEVATAAVMGNLYAESGIKTNNLENSKESKLGYSDETYTQAINSGTYTKEQFMNDSAGYGLAQWTYPTRKEGLYKYCSENGYSIDDENAQIKYLLAELGVNNEATIYISEVQINQSRKGYSKKDWLESNDIDTATTAFCWIFENPSAPALEKRKNQAKTYYNIYQGQTMPQMGSYTGSEGEKMCQAAQRILEHTAANGYKYDVTVPDYSRGVRALWDEKGVCCASFVAWTLVESGVVPESYINTLPFRGATSLGNGLSKIFPKVNVTSQAQLQKGDIVIWPGHHTQFYAGDGYWYNGGVTKGNPVKYSKYDAFSVYSKWSNYYVLRPVQQ